MQPSPSYGVVDPERRLSDLILDFSSSDNLLWQANSAASAMDQLETHVPDLLLTRLQLPDMSGAMFCNWLTETFPQLPVIVVSTSSNLEYVEELMMCGVCGYLTLQHSEQHLESAINQAIEGGAYFSEDVLKMLIKELPGPGRFQPQREAYALNRVRHQQLIEHIIRMNRLSAQGAVQQGRLKAGQRKLASLLQTENT
ncbi:MAG: response regulator [Bacteroidota bacterium]